MTGFNLSDFEVHRAKGRVHVEMTFKGSDGTDWPYVFDFAADIPARALGMFLIQVGSRIVDANRTHKKDAS